MRTPWNGPRGGTAEADGAGQTDLDKRSAGRGAKPDGTSGRTAGGRNIDRRAEEASAQRLARDHGTARPTNLPANSVPAPFIEAHEESAVLDIGLDEPDRVRVGDGLDRVLADTALLYLKTHNYHWNLTGPLFSTLHPLLDQQYRELWAALDELAERVRALGRPAPATFASFLQLSQLREDEPGVVPDEMTMLANLLHDHEALCRSIRSLLSVAEDAGDHGTVDLLSKRLRDHEGAAWMLRASLERQPVGGRKVPLPHGPTTGDLGDVAARATVGNAGGGQPWQERHG